MGTDRPSGQRTVQIQPLPGHEDEQCACIRGERRDQVTTTKASSTLQCGKIVRSSRTCVGRKVVSTSRRVMGKYRRECGRMEKKAQ